MKGLHKKIGKVDAAWKRLFVILGSSLVFHKADSSVPVVMSVAGPDPWDIWGQLFTLMIGKRL